MLPEFLHHPDRLQSLTYSVGILSFLTVALLLLDNIEDIKCAWITWTVTSTFYLSYRKC